MRSKIFDIGRLGTGHVDQYNFNWGGSIDAVSRENLPPANYETAHQYLDENGNLISVDANGYVYKNGQIVTCGAWKELCLYSTNPGAAGWGLSGATRSADTENNVGPFLAHRIISSGNLDGRATFYRSTSAPASGAPTGIICKTLYILPGSSGKIQIRARDLEGLNSAYYQGDIGACSISQGTSVTLTVLSDSINPITGYRVIRLLANFANKANSLSLAVGPYSATAGEDIIVLGASVAGAVGTGDITTERPFTETTGSVATLSSLSADLVNGRGPRVTYAGAPKLLDGLDGRVNGTIALEDYFDTNTTGSYSVSNSLNGATSYVDNSYLRCTILVTSADTWGLYKTGVLISGKTYDVKFKSKGTRSAVFGSILTVGSVGIVFKNPAITTSWQEYHFRVVSTTTTLRLYIVATGGLANDTIDFDDIVIEEVSPALGQIEWAGTPSGLPAADNQVLACNTTQGLLIMKADGSAQVNGQRYSATLASAFAAGTESKIIIPYEPGEMKLVKDATSTVTDFSGTFGPSGTVFGIGPGTSHMTHKSLKIFKRPRVTLDGMTTVYSGTVSGMLISAVAGKAFFDNLPAEVLALADGNHLIEVTDAAGKKLVAVMAAVGTGETLGSELLLNTNMDNTNNFGVSAGSISSVAGGVSGNCLSIDHTTNNTAFSPTSGGIDYTHKGLYKNSAYHKSGTAGNISLSMVLRYVGSDMSRKAVTTSTYWQQVVNYGTAGLTGVVLRINFEKPVSNGSVLIDEISTKQVLTPSTSGITLVSHKDSLIQSLMYDDSAFAFNQVAPYGVTVKEME